MKILFLLPVPVFMCLNIVYRISCCKDDIVTLMVDKLSFDARRYNKYLEALKLEKIFNEVIFGDLFIDRAHLPTKSDEIKDYVIGYYNRHFADIGFDLTCYDEIVVTNDNWCADINLYLNYIERNYRWIEVGPNALLIGRAGGYPKLLKDEFNRLNAESAIAKYACPVLWKESNYSVCRMKEIEKEYELWSLADSIKGLSDDTLKKIMNSYKVGDDFEKDFALFVVNSFGTSIYASEIGFLNNYGKKVIGYTECELDEWFAVIYCLLLDIYIPNSMVYIKFHPNDPMLERRMSELYSANIKIFPEVPLELVCEYFLRGKKRIKHLLGMQSTSLLGVNDALYEHKIILGLDFYATMHYYASLYIISFLLDFLSIDKIAASEAIANQLQILSKGRLECTHIKGYEHVRLMENSGAFIVLDAIHYVFSEEVIRNIGNDNFICFLNVDLSNSFMPSDLFLEFVPIKIEKKAKCISSSLMYSEVLWIYTKNRYKRRTLRKFCFAKEMLFSNICLCTKTHTFQEEIELAKHIVGKNKLELLNKKLQYLYGTEKLLLEIAMESDDVTHISLFLHQCDDISEYLSLLSVFKRKYMVICAVRDTPGSYINLDLLSKIRSLGFEKFTTELWRMYVGIVWEDKTLFDMCGAEREAPIDICCNNSYYETNIHIVSKAWRKGNVANIYIDGKDFSTNIRGINIVVYDPKGKMVLDSIGFDGHANYRFVRRPI